MCIYIKKISVCTEGNGMGGWGYKLLKVWRVNDVVLIVFGEFSESCFLVLQSSEVQAVSHWGLILKSLLNFLFGSSVVNFPLGCLQIRRN